MTILNVAAYKFVPINDALALKETLLERGLALQLKGTILLAEEGINLFLAGAPEALRSFMQALKSDVRFTDMPVKESDSESTPFRKFLVKIRREIIRMNHPQIKPADTRAPAVDAATLKSWLDTGRDDAGREVVMIDTRNAFELNYGTFEGTHDFSIAKFTEFPDAIATHAKEFEGKTVVTFCTGGIRCEKAALYMRDIGMQHVYQLDGGILKYFEEMGQAHYKGSCFVFDEREALNANLRPEGQST
jgi:UPF0176 protein